MYVSIYENMYVSTMYLSVMHYYVSMYVMHCYVSMYASMYVMMVSCRKRNALLCGMMQQHAVEWNKTMRERERAGEGERERGRTRVMHARVCL